MTSRPFASTAKPRAVLSDHCDVAPSALSRPPAASASPARASSTTSTAARSPRSGPPTDGRIDPEDLEAFRLDREYHIALYGDIRGGVAGAPRGNLNTVKNGAKIGRLNRALRDLAPRTRQAVQTAVAAEVLRRAAAAPNASARHRARIAAAIDVIEAYRRAVAVPPRPATNSTATCACCAPWRRSWLERTRLARGSSMTHVLTGRRSTPVAAIGAVLLLAALAGACGGLSEAEEHYNRGVDLQNSGELDPAIANYDRAIELDPKYADAYNNRGNAYSDLGNLEQAIADYDRAIGLDPDLAMAYASRGTAYSDLGNFEQAIADYDRAIELAPSNSFAYANRGVAHIKLRHLERALSDLETVVSLTSDASLKGQIEELIESVKAAR